MDKVTVICNVEHLIEVGVCALCQRDSYENRMRTAEYNFSVEHKALVDSEGENTLLRADLAKANHSAGLSATAPTIEQVKALHRITPSKLTPDEQQRRNGEYVSLYEVLDLFKPNASTAESSKT